MTHLLVNPLAWLDDLTYASYTHNRRISPEVTPERWAKIMSNVPAMEARYQAELFPRCEFENHRGQCGKQATVFSLEHEAFFCEPDYWRGIYESELGR